jgi:TRAP-type mannitol/chloroaromatic compound transport system permease small subunit
MRHAVRLIEGISRVLGGVAAALVFVLMLLMAYEVALRYAFNAPTIWSHDITTMTMGAAFVLSIAYTLATNAHVRVDILKPLLGRRGAPLVDFIGHAFVLLPLLVWLSWALWEYFHGAFVSQERSGTSAWNPVVWPFRAVLFVGTLAWTLQTAAEAVKSAYALAGRPLEPAPEAPGTAD